MVKAGDRIRITSVHLDPGRLGRIDRVRDEGIYGEPLYTICLDRSGAPGAALSEGSHANAFRWIDLRRDEFEPA